LERKEFAYHLRAQAKRLVALAAILERDSDVATDRAVRCLLEQEANLLSRRTGVVGGEPMVLVKFNFPDEFLEELTKDKALVYQGIVRLTQVFGQEQKILVVTHVSVVATAKVGPDVIRMDHRIGSYSDHPGVYGGDRETVLKKSREALDTIQAQFEQLGLEVRAGIYEPGDTKNEPPRSEAG